MKISFVMFPFDPKRLAIRALRQRNQNELLKIIRYLEEKDEWQTSDASNWAKLRDKLFAVSPAYAISDWIECENSLIQCQGVIGAPTWLEERVALLDNATPPTLEEVEVQMQASADVIREYEIIHSRENAG